MMDADTALALNEDAATLALLHDRELSPEVIASLKAINFPGNLGMVPLGEKSRQVFEVMQGAVAILPDFPEPAFMDNLAADYAAIYLTGALEASPFESFWVSDEHLLCQEAMFEMRELYAEEGLQVPDWRQRQDDHLVFQLQFLDRHLERIAVGSTAKPGSTDPDQWRALAVLLDHHLLRWLPEFARKVSQRCDTAFYAALALLTDVWCQELRYMIALHLAEPRPSAEEIEQSLRPNQLAEVRVDPVRFMPGIGGPSW
jgi:TorA maturation chaperone TorD